jgi:hypothetical protein
MSPKRSPTGRRRRARTSPTLFPVEAVRIFRSSGPPSRVVAGVDEAGLGPLLGPLAIGYSVFRPPAPGLSLASVLENVIASAPARIERKSGKKKDATVDPRLLVADSKIVFERNPKGEARLETVALAFLALAAPSRCAPESGHAFLSAIPADLRSSVDATIEPWCAHLPGRLPMRAEPAEIARHVVAIAAEMSTRAIAILDAGVRWVTPGDLNASFERTENKSRSHWELSAPILKRIYRDHGREGVDVLVDRHGGRMRYGALLEETFPGAHVARLFEERTVSEYSVASVEGGEKMRMRIAFAERAEGASLAVALASCLAKYARELSMRAFNDYFGSLQPGLKPTAGYFSDGWRWLEEAQPAIERSGLHRSRLVRAR